MTSTTAYTADADSTNTAVDAAAVIADQTPDTAAARSKTVARGAVTRTDLTSVHALRGVAMLAVVTHHVLRWMMQRLGNLRLDGSVLKQYPVLAEFACGVDMFFVISGFLLLLISKPYLDRRRTIQNFMMHRIIRIWPLYAIVSCVVLAKQWSQTVAVGLPLPLDFQPIRLAGILFIPSFDEDYMLRPIYKPGWTLSYEVWFYGCLATAMAFASNRRELLLGVTSLILGGMVIGHNLPEGSVAAAFFAEPLAMEFVFGAAIYVYLQSGRRIPFPPAVWLAAGFIWLVAFAGYNADEGWRLGTRGIPAAFFLIGMLKLEGKVTFPAWLIVVSSAAYSIFLTHAIFLPRLTEVALNLLDKRVPHAMLGELASVFVLVTSVLMGIVCFKLLEKPLSERCKAWVGQ